MKIESSTGMACHQAKRVRPGRDQASENHDRRKLRLGFFLAEALKLLPYLFPAIRDHLRGFDRRFGVHQGCAPGELVSQSDQRMTKPVAICRPYVRPDTVGLPVEILDKLSYTLHAAIAPVPLGLAPVGGSIPCGLLGIQPSGLGFPDCLASLAESQVRKERCKEGSGGTYRRNDRVRAHSGLGPTNVPRCPTVKTKPSSRQTASACLTVSLPTPYVWLSAVSVGSRSRRQGHGADSGICPGLPASTPGGVTC